MSQIDDLAAIFDDMPGDAATWTGIAARLERLRRHSDPAYRGRERDDTVDEVTWKHLRNISRVVGEMARSFAAMEGGQDPDTYAMYGTPAECPRCRQPYAHDDIPF